MAMRFTTDPCPEEHAFRFQNGARARSLQELRATVGQVPPEVLTYHRGHFHHWVRDVVQEPRLAERLREAGERTPDPQALRSSIDQILDGALRQAGPGGPASGGRKRARR